MIRNLALFLAATAALAAVITVALRAAGTIWAVPVAVIVVVVAFAGDWLSEHRPSGLTALERFEARERRRAA